MIMNKSILFITGTRADFGKLEPLATAAKKEGYEIAFFTTGMHMLEKYGSTKFEVASVEGAKSFEFINQRLGDPLDIILAKTITGLSDFVYETKPDLVVIHGDRIEALGSGHYYFNQLFAFCTHRRRRSIRDNR